MARRSMLPGTLRVISVDGDLPQLTRRLPALFMILVVISLLLVPAKAGRSDQQRLCCFSRRLSRARAEKQVWLDKSPYHHLSARPVHSLFKRIAGHSLPVINSRGRTVNSAMTFADRRRRRYMLSGGVFVQKLRPLMETCLRCDDFANLCPLSRYSHHRDDFNPRTYTHTGFLGRKF